MSAMLYVALAIQMLFLQTAVGQEAQFRATVERVRVDVSVTDEEVRTAQRFAFSQLNLVVEPGGAAALAAALAGKVPVDEGTVIMVTGGNTDADSFAAMLGQV